MRRVAEGERKNNADMAHIMKAMSPTEREAMARYISGSCSDCVDAPAAVLLQAATISREERRSGSIDTLTFLPNTTKSIGEDIQAEAKLKIANSGHGRQSWMPMDLVAGGS